jgi:hypothetical protein
MLALNGFTRTAGSLVRTDRIFQFHWAFRDHVPVLLIAIEATRVPSNIRADCA